jgi:predicted pyridoxine 5'-phosphate oxidase superfamily flavin-nucleotide-binding protein
MDKSPRRFPSDVAFSDSVKAVQARKGSREANARMEEAGWETVITPELADFIARQTSFFLATASASGQPYIQHRGGPAGFLRVRDEKTLAFADFLGNRQFVTLGNLAENAKAQIFLIDYDTRERIKIWGTARVVEDAGLLASLMPAGYRARGEQVLVFDVGTWDMNCSQHIPQRFAAEEVKRELRQREDRIRELEDELKKLKGA